jgi:hypothetical protein
LTPGGFSMKLPIASSQCFALYLPQRFSPTSNIESIVSCLCVMVLLGHTFDKLQNLDYNKIPLQKVHFLPIAFDGDVFFKLPLVFLIVHRLSQMQGMDRKYDGHVWCKVITTNIKNSFGLSFKKACCLGDL